jgi:hypothetical protein
MAYILFISKRKTKYFHYLYAMFVINIHLQGSKIGKCKHIIKNFRVTLYCFFMPVETKVEFRSFLCRGIIPLSSACPSVYLSLRTQVTLWFKKSMFNSYRLVLVGKKVAYGVQIRCLWGFRDQRKNKKRQLRKKVRPSQTFFRTTSQNVLVQFQLNFTGMINTKSRCAYHWVLMDQWFWPSNSPLNKKTGFAL